MNEKNRKCDKVCVPLVMAYEHLGKRHARGMLELKTLCMPLPEALALGSRNQQNSSREGMTYFYFLKVILGIVWKMALSRERK